MNLILLPFVLMGFFLNINCEYVNLIKKNEPHYKNRKIERDNSNDIFISDTLSHKNVSFLKLLKNDYAFSKFENASKIENEIIEKTYDGAIKKHSKVIFYSKTDSARFFLREKKHSLLLSLEIYSNDLVFNTLFRIGLSKKDFENIYTQSNTIKKDLENLNFYGINSNELIKNKNFNNFPDIYYITDAEELSFFEFKFKNDKLISIIYKNNNWE